jgi:hypothetical protein
MTRIVEESREREKAKNRERACLPMWRPIEVEGAKHARLRPKASKPGVPSGPSARYKTFERYAQRLEKQVEGGCDVRGRDVFEVEWAYLVQEEASRAESLKALEAQAISDRETRDAEREAREKAVTAEARRKGFHRVEFGRSLAEVLQALVEEAAPVSDLRNVAIELSSDDLAFEAQQQVGDGQGIFISGDVTLWVVAPGASIYKGTPLPSLVSSERPFVTVTGTKSYTNVLGSRTQAFVVKPVW